MRIWSLHPSTLDVRGLVACWRETLLAKNVLSGQTKGYKNHPQLDRFKSTSDPIFYINLYLYTLYQEACNRGYNFDFNKIGRINIEFEMPISCYTGQIDFEVYLLKEKVKKRQIDWIDNVQFSVNPIFNLVSGGVESWEKHESLDKYMLGDLRNG
ncbi:MAG: pyrimidine dimer DNA glycosylase/endonuclease V [bacterium]